MTNGDPEGRIFLSYTHTNNGFFFLLTTVFIYLFIYLFILKFPEYAKMNIFSIVIIFCFHSVHIQVSVDVLLHPCFEEALFKW